MDEDLSHINDKRELVVSTEGAEALSIAALDLQHKRLIDLARVDAALERLENDTFGICTGCGVELDLAVLAKDPVVSKCSFCSSETDSSHKPVSAN